MKLTVRSDPHKLKLTMAGPTRTEHIAVTDGYEGTGVTQWLFAQAGLMHLVAPYFPDIITTDFPVSLQTQLLIERMYRFEGAVPPEFRGPGPERTPRVLRWTTARRAVVEYSGGKDSMDNLARAQERYGRDNVLAVHIAGLAKGVGAAERRASIEQSRRFKFPLRIVELTKSTMESGAKVLRSAKVFDACLVAPVALEFGARHIITEEPGGPYFTGSRGAMELLNGAFFGRSGIPLMVRWWDRPHDGVVKHLIKHRPDWLPYVCNCFSPMHYRIGIRKSWLRRTPTFRPFKNACGSCIKCRLTRLGWLLYGPHHASRADAVYFIRDCEQWARHKQSTHQDLIGGSFSLYLERARRRYGLQPRYE